MPAATLTRRATQWLTERTVPDSSPLVVDEAKDIIYGVRVCGQFSKNCHGIPNVTEGTEYTPDAQRKAVSIYEGQTVYTDHPSDRRFAGGDRPVRDVFGSLKQVRVVRESNGETATRADLHFLKSNPMAASVVEDVKKGMGLYGLSHNARAGKARVSNGRFIVEEIAEVRSVDLVDRPATNKNLWESSGRKPMTLREIINDRLANWPPHTVKIAKRLLEEDAPPMGDAPADAPVASDAPSADDDPEAQLWAGFMAAIMSIINGDGSASDKAKQIAKYLKAHEKLTDGGGSSSDSSDEDEDTSAKESKESLEREVRTLRATTALQAVGVKDPPAHIVKALAMLESESERKAFIADFAGKTSTSKPRSYAPPPPARKTSDAPKKPPTNVDEFVQQLRG